MTDFTEYGLDDSNAAKSPVTSIRTWWTKIFTVWIPALGALVTIAAFVLTQLPSVNQSPPTVPDIPTVPNVRLADEATAIQMLREANYEPEVNSEADDIVPKGRASRTNPAGGTPFPAGQHVKLYISAGPLCEYCAAPSNPPLPPSTPPVGPSSPPTRYPPQVPPVPLPSNKPPPPTTTPPPPTFKRTCPPTSSADQPATTGLEIALPRQGALLAEGNDSSGMASLGHGEHLWVLLCAPKAQEPGKPGGLFYLEADETKVDDGIWSQRYYVDTAWPGDYYLYAIIVNDEDSRGLAQTMANGGKSPFVFQLPQSARYVSVKVRCCAQN